MKQVIEKQREHSKDSVSKLEEKRHQYGVIASEINQFFATSTAQHEKSPDKLYIESFMRFAKKK